MINIKSKVIHGFKQGRKVDFPTINIKIKNNLNGVYYGLIKIRSIIYKAIIISKENSDLIECHILDFNDDVYGEEISIIEYKKIRNIQKYKSKEDMINQRKKDKKILEGKNYEYV